MPVVTGLIALVTCAACAHNAEPYSAPRSDDETPSILVPGEPTTRTLLVEVSAITSGTAHKPTPLIKATADVGVTVPTIAFVSNCIEIGRASACIMHACEGFPDEPENPSGFTAGPIHIEVGEGKLVLQPQISGRYDHASLGIPELLEVPVTSIPLVIRADGRRIPSFRIETKFPPHGLLLIPGRNVVADDFSKPLFVGAAPPNEDLVLTIDPPDASVDVIVTGTMPGFPDGCPVGTRCTATTHCVFPEGHARVPASIFAHYQLDTTMDVTILTARHVHERREDFDIDVVTQTSANRVRYLLH